MSWPPPPPCSPWRGGAACSTGGAGADPDRVDVVAAFYPLQFLAERIGGDAVTRHQPGQARRRAARPGTQPAPGRPGQRRRADRLPQGLPAGGGRGRGAERRRPGVRRGRRAAAARRDRRRARPRHEGEDGHAERGDGGKDPHVWLDPTRLATIGDKLAERLGAADPDHAADYTARAAALRAELAKLDTEYAARPGDLPAAGDRDQPRRLRLPRRRATGWSRSASPG